MHRRGMTSPNRRYATPPIYDGPLPLMWPRVATGWGMSYLVYAVLTIFLFVFVGCKEPMSVEKFVEGEGPYTFFVDMGDTTAAYDFDFYTRIDAPADSLAKVTALPLQVTWTSPTFHVFREEVYMPLEGRITAFSRQVRVPYRADVRPEEPGPWTVMVRVTDPPKGLRGMGLVVERKR